MGSAFGALLTSDLSVLNYDTDKAGLLGFVSSICGNVLGILIGRWTDKARNQKLLLCIMLTISCVSFMFFALIVQKVFPDPFTFSNAGYAALFVTATCGEWHAGCGAPHRHRVRLCG